ncbi:DAK2 domain-containing protein [Streptomyces iconiensis]|uniref:DAK2 domain-containing protein n=1 Tax=Streptomyces iconiensis TaxID=1384038 RepID=A0ABT6ZTX7_9ACTN|nr:DAK2 domain-containing protein [Streptomyces iconiensis]MDJ1132526.1 DAK2 domain-containing protein [Streptomyces iconiensis]
MPHPFDALAVRRWCALGREALRAECARMDAINVFPVADGDTGTNLCLTFEAAAGAAPYAEAEGAAGAAGAEEAAVDREGREGTQDGEGTRDGEHAGAGALRAMARAALLDARGNSGTILAEYLRGMAQGLAAPGDAPLARALRGGADAAYAAVAHPVEGTMLTVAAAAAAAAEDGRDPVAAARTALAATPDQLAALSRAGVVDAGAVGLTALLDALRAALRGDTAHAGASLPAGEAPGGEAPEGKAVTEPAAGESRTREPAIGEPVSAPPAGRSAGQAEAPEGPGAAAFPEFEVMYLIEAAGPEAVQALREALDPLGDSLVIGGGDGLWSVHVHVADAGAAVEAGIAAGRPYRIRIAHLPGNGAAEPCAGTDGADRAPVPARAVVAVVPGDGLAGLCGQAGATVVPASDAARGDVLLAAMSATGAAEVVLLPNGAEFHPAAARAAEAARAKGVRATVIPTRAAVQGLAALAVHEPERHFDEDVVTMTSAAGATRYGEVAVAARESWTMAGICQAGDVLGLVEGDVAVIGADIRQVAMDVLVRMLAAGGEMVTLVLGEGAPHGLTDALEAYVRRTHLAVDTVVYEGRQRSAPLLIGVE